MRLVLLTFLLFSFLTITAQPWANKDPQQRNDKISFLKYQQDFYQYCKDKGIVDGYYYENGVKKKASGWKQFKRWENYWESRVDRSTGAFPGSAQYRIADDQFNNSKIRSAAGNWESLGPSSSAGGYAGVGRINRIAFHPQDPNTFWVTTPQGGVWTTTDDGANWTTITDNEDILGTTAIAVHPNFQNTPVIYIGTGDTDSWRHDTGIGVLKSNDGGVTWEQTGLVFDPSMGYTVNKLLIHPDDHQTVFAATSNGLYKTYDGGDIWYRIYSEQYLADLEFKPGDPSTLYASSRYWGRIYKFTDDGYDIDVVIDDYDDGSKRIELAVSPMSPNNVYALVVDEDGGLKELLRSTNSGSSYSKILVPGPSLSKPNILSRDKNGTNEGGQGYFDLTMLVNPMNPNHIMVGGINNWESFDGGYNWDLNNYWTSWGCSGCEIVHADKHDLAYNNGAFYECNDGGLYKSVDGVNWTNISNGITNSQIYKLGVSTINTEEVIAGLQDNGTKLMSGNSWTDVEGGDGMECLIDYSNQNIQYCIIQNGQDLMKTTNHWQSKTNIVPNNAEGAWETPYIIDPTDPATLYAGYQHIYKTTNRGISWNIIFNQNSESKFRCMAIAPSNNKVLYVSDSDDLWRTTNGGNSWTKLTNNGIPNEIITSITVKNDDPNTLWLTFGHYTGNLVYQSTNGGNSWSNLSQGLPNIPANTLVQNKTNTDQVELYLGTDFGAYVKRGDIPWQYFNDGMPKLVVRELEIAYDPLGGDSHQLMAATYGRGLWKSDLLSTNLPPTANFVADRTVASAGESILFTSTSLNGPTSWEWQFEDGNPASSNTETQYVSFSAPGTYSVTLTATNDFGSDTEIKEDYITILCDALNYSSSKAESLVGDYIDLGNLGTEIITSNFDDANSDPVDIGFEFYFNCSPFTQFILNTNGFIKLGDSPPSSAALFFDQSTGNNGGIFNSTASEDVNLIIPFNHDLKGSAFPEYRVHTSGNAPNRICTIQFEGLADKTTDPPQQFNNIKFQIKLYEGSNLIEFIYGDWIESSNQSAYKSAACGLKGSSNADENLLVVGKTSSQIWADVYFENANYLPGAFGMNFGSPPDRPKPDRGRTYRFTPNLDEDIMVGPLRALGTASIYNSNPQTISVYIKNIGSRAATNLPVSLDITGSNPFSDVQVIPTLEAGAAMTVEFAPYSPMLTGDSEMTVSVPDDDSNSDNSSSWTQTCSEDMINYCSDENPASIFGFNAGFEGIFLSKYEIKGTAAISSVDAYLVYYTTNVGQKVFGVLMDENGDIIAQTPDHTLAFQTMNQWFSLEFNDTHYVTDETIYVGLATRATINGQAYYVMGVQEEVPTRENTYYTSTITGAGLTPKDASFGYRYMLGLTANPPMLEGEAAADASDICEGESTTVFLTGNHNSVQWEESSDASSWSNVSGGSGGNTQNYTTPVLESTRYYRARVDNGMFILYSNIVMVAVHPSYSQSESFNICVGEDFTFPDGSTETDIQAGMVYTSVLKTIFDCDSTIVTKLIVDPVYFDQETMTICYEDSYTFPDGHVEMYITEDMVYESMFTTVAGCDSVIETTLHVEEVDISVGVTEGTLIAYPADLSYQWLDCDDNFSPIANENGQQYAPYLTGNYAVIVDDGTCADTSDCHYIIGSTIDEINENGLSIYPNPSRGKLKIESEKLKIEDVELINILGKIERIKEINKLTDKSFDLDLSNFDAGVYFIRIKIGEQLKVKRVILTE